MFTTGATLNEAAKILKKAGAGKVYIFTLGRVVVGKRFDRLLRKIIWYFREIKKIWMRQLRQKEYAVRNS